MERISFFAKVKKKLFLKKHGEVDENRHGMPEEKMDNPYLPYIRKIMEAVLSEKNISYRDFFPILIDGDEPEKTLFVAEELGLELNRLAILTDKSEYFQDCRDTMYEEQGLIMEIFPKEKENLAVLLKSQDGDIVVLDFEKENELIDSGLSEKTLYIPIFKKRWESAGNLDITVPIGYNTLIVRGIDFTKKQPVLDKFEQAFYDKE